MNRFEFIKKVHKAKYEKGGRDIESSIDCWGLVTEYYRLILGINIEPHEELVYDRNSEQVSKDIKKVFKNEYDSLSSPEKNAIVILIFSGKPIHIGVMISDDKILNLFQNKYIKSENIQQYIDKNMVYGYFKPKDSQ